MSKELLAALALGLSLIASVFAGGMRIGTLTERIDAQSKQLDAQGSKIDALSADLNGTRAEILRLLGNHLERTGR